MDNHWKKLPASAELGKFLLTQGDWLGDCAVATPPSSLKTDDKNVEAFIDTYDLILVSQTCDLVNEPSYPYVAACPICSIQDYELDSAKTSNADVWNGIRKGRQEGLYLLPNPREPNNAWASLVVDFRLILSLSTEYAREVARKQPERYRLDSPFLEHFSQAFARFFMRVGLPGGVTEFKGPSPWHKKT